MRLNLDMTINKWTGSYLGQLFLSIDPLNNYVSIVLDPYTGFAVSFLKWRFINLNVELD